MAAAKGMLPLSREEMVEALVTLASDPDEGVRSAVNDTMSTLDPASLTGIAGDEKSSEAVLGYLLLRDSSPRELLEAIVFNRSTPDAALAQLAGRCPDAAVLEAISIKQQSLIRCPDIIEALLANPNRTPEAERRAREVQQEFFEKQFGAKMVAGEQRAQQQPEPAAEEGPSLIAGSLEDLIALGLIDPEIEVSDVDDYLAELGPVVDEPEAAESRLDIEKMALELEADEIDLPADRMPVYQQIALMSVKDRVMLAIRGTREARMILVRDPNRLVAAAVIRNPRITDNEIESVAAMKTVSEEVLRLIASSRSYTKSYVIIHNLVRNPRTPIAISMGFLNRIQSKDLRQLSTNKNVPDVIRQTSARLFLKRTGIGG
ncbi:MAG TPA: hypothetical protein VKJ45_00930 [Blastocatellia bacterium]|nr:hypothetical protein [Blastocatellia bacterium]